MIWWLTIQLYFHTDHRLVRVRASRPGRCDVVVVSEALTSSLHSSPVGSGGKPRDHFVP